jgi:hypothetical protein
MDDWHDRVRRELLGQDARSELATDASLEIALGQARSEMAYVLSFGQAYKLPVAGAVNGDDVWLRIGEATVRARLDRKTRALHLEAPGQDARLVGASELSGMRDLVRAAIDSAIAAHKRGGA